MSRGKRYFLPAILLLILLVMTLTMLCGCEPGSQEPGKQVWFEDQAMHRGLDFQHQSGFSGNYWLPEITTGGAALADLDGDGDIDAYLVQGGRIPGGNVDAPGNRLYFNQGNGHFHAADSGAEDRGYGMGVATGDYDNDGDIDLYVTNLGANVLLRNDGAGHFDNVTTSSGVADDGWGTAAAFLDLDHDGDLDLFLVNYLHWSPVTAKECFSPDIRTYCGPTSADAQPDRLFRNNGDGTFTDVSLAAGINVAYGSGLGIVGADVNGDGLMDVFVANDGMVNQLWLNQGNLRFVDESFLWGCAMDDHGIAKAGMGVAAADVDDDQDVDILVMNLARQTDSFYRNEGTHFVDATSMTGLGAPSSRFTRFGVALADFDNDGVLDVYEANGRTLHTPEHSDDDFFAQPNSLFRGLGGGRFEPVRHQGGTLATLVHTSRGVVKGDIDNDGGIDLLVINRDARPYLLMNQIYQRGHWARFRVLTRYGRDAHGATVSAIIGGKRQYRNVQVAASYLAANDPRVHFGLDSHTGILDVEVRWPSGESEAFGDFPADRTAILQYGEGAKNLGTFQ